MRPARAKTRWRRVPVVTICSPKPIARRPAGQVVGQRLDRQPGGVGGEAPREMVEAHTVLEVPDGVLHLGVAAMVSPPVPGCLPPGR